MMPFKPLCNTPVFLTPISLTSNTQRCMTTIRASPESSDPVPILSGVKQGCPLSAIHTCTVLFVLTMELILTAVNSEGSSLLKNTTLYHHYILLSCLAYADDLVLVAQSRDAQQELLDSVSTPATLLAFSPALTSVRSSASSTAKTT